MIFLFYLFKAKIVSIFVIVLILKMIFSYFIFALDVDIGLNYGAEIQQYEISPYPGMPLSKLSFSDSGVYPTLRLTYSMRRFQNALEVNYVSNQFLETRFSDIDYDLSREYSSVFNTEGQEDIRSSAYFKKKGWRFLYTLDYHIRSFFKMKVYSRIGFYYAQTRYLVYDAKQWYPSSEIFYDNNGVVAKKSTVFDSEDSSRLIPGDVLSYDTVFYGPLFGAKTQINFNKVVLQLGFLWSPFLTIQDNDYHILRDKVSGAVHEGRFLNGDISVMTSFFERFDLQCTFFGTSIIGHSGGQTQTTYEDSTLAVVKNEVPGIPHSFYSFYYGFRMEMRYNF